VAGIFLQALLLSGVSRRVRACVGLSSLFAANLTMFVAFFSAEQPLTENIWLAGLCYNLIGIGRSISETNCQSVFAAYGVEAQRFLSFGSASAWTGAGTLYFTLEAIVRRATWALPAGSHVASCCLCVVGGAILLAIPEIEPTPESVDSEHLGRTSPSPKGESADTLGKMAADVREWREWVPNTRVRVVVGGVTGAMGSFAIAFVQLTYSSGDQTLLPGVTVSPGIFMIIFCACECVGGALGAFLVPHLRHPDVFIGLSTLLALACMFSREPLLGVASSGIMWAAFTVSSTLSAVTIATQASKRYTLTAMAFAFLLVRLCTIVTMNAAGSWSVIVGRVGDTS
jgi:hypothetical protein